MAAIRSSSAANEERGRDIKTLSVQGGEGGL